MSEQLSLYEEVEAVSERAGAVGRAAGEAMSPPVGLVLSLFPGADLLGRAFEEAGYCVVRGPDVLWGGDVRSFRPARARFDGVIGGPPCQFASLARHGAKRPAINMIPEFLRVVDQARPRWAVMENVRNVTAKGAAPPWPWADVRDADCGGVTNRVRRFWFHGIPPPLVGRAMPNPRDLAGAKHSVLASDWKRARCLEDLDRAAASQGFPELGRLIADAQPGEKRAPVAARSLAIHMLGNGVPRAMGLFVASHVRRCDSPAGEVYSAGGGSPDAPKTVDCGTAERLRVTGRAS